MPDNTTATPLKLVKEYFGLKLNEMRTEWTPMPQKDKDEILAGLRDGTLTY
ncbi:hypothetical protein [Streptomyces sp. NPDC046925]|uniref:hypothetical protein n=1 Tax=Streptomyces sp. NPDC046925 TaxID=3155375 RepID=UPI0033F61DE4